MIPRRLTAVVLGLVAWFVLVTIVGRVLQAAWPAYVARVETFDFTVSMLIARLLIGAVVTVVAGRVAAWWAPQDRPALWLLGVALVAIFVPVHVQLWSKFPVIYHAAFLLSLVPLTLAGGNRGAGRMGVAAGAAPWHPESPAGSRTRHG